MGFLKGQFIRALPVTQRMSRSRVKRKEQGKWQRPFWGHLLTSQEDFNAHFD